VRICKGCGKSCERVVGVIGRYCSNECKIKNPKSEKKCKPACSPSTTRVREVEFKNETKHFQLFCLICERTTYVKRKFGVTAIHEEKAIQKRSEFVRSRYDATFYNSPEWLKLRHKVLITYGPKCMLCGSVDGSMHVDHIKPRSKFPRLQLEFSNLQVLCRECNIGKGASDATDWRK